MAYIYQFFVIAKIDGRYRCLSAFYYRCSLLRFLYDCLAQIRLFGSDCYRSNIRHELEYANTLPRTFWDTNPNSDFWPYKNSAGKTRQLIPFPFISTCHVLSRNLVEKLWCINKYNPFDREHIDSVFVEGIAVVDITNVSRISYCLASISECNAIRQKVPLLTPLSAAEFVKEYNMFNEMTVGTDYGLKSFAKWTIIDFKVLEATWPRTNWRRRIMDSEGSSQIQHSVMNRSTKSGDPVPTLRNLAYEKVLDIAFGDTADTDLTWLSDAELLYDFNKNIKKRLYENPSIIETSPNAVTLLAKVIADDDEVDLSSFRTLSPVQLYQLLDQSKCTSLDLASIRSITPSVLAEVLKNRPWLESLNVMGIPNLSLHKLGATISRSVPGSMIKNLSHSQMFSKHFAHDKRTESFEPTLMYGSMSPVVQLLYVNTAISASEYLASRGVPLTRVDREREGVSPEIFSLPIYMGKTFLPVDKVITGLIDFLKMLQGINRPQLTYEKFYKKTVETFAYPGIWQKASMRGYRKADQVTDALPNLATASSLAWYSYGKINPYRATTPKPGQWTIIIVNGIHDFTKNPNWRSHPTETKPLDLRYAFVTSSQGENEAAETLDVDMRIPLEPHLRRSSRIRERSSLDGSSIQYKDSLLVADVDEFLKIVLPQNTNGFVSDLRTTLLQYCNSNVDFMERFQEKAMQRSEEQAAVPGEKPIALEKTRVCSTEEVEEVLRFFLDAQDQGEQPENPADAEASSSQEPQQNKRKKSGKANEDDGRELGRGKRQCVGPVKYAK